MNVPTFLVPRTRRSTKCCFAEPGPYQTPALATVPALRGGTRAPHRVGDTNSQTPLPARDGACDLAGDVALRAAEAVGIGRRDRDVDHVAAAAAGDAEPAVGAALQRHDRFGACLAGEPRA